MGLTVEHGCDGSPTVALSVRVPAGSFDPVAEPPAGWSGAVDGDVVNFTGGSLPADVEETFRVTVTLPLTPGETVYFPMVQTCEVGELRWIDVPADGSGTELDEPAPAMELGEPLPDTTAPTTAAPTTAAPTTVIDTTVVDTAPPATDAATTVADTAAPTTESATVETEPLVIAPAPDAGGDTDDDDDGSGGNPVAIGLGVVALAAVVVAGVMLGKRRRR